MYARAPGSNLHSSQQQQQMHKAKRAVKERN
jgi:hypothetical protein